MTKISASGRNWRNMFWLPPPGEGGARATNTAGRFKPAPFSTGRILQNRTVPSGKDRWERPGRPDEADSLPEAVRNVKSRIGPPRTQPGRALVAPVAIRPHGSGGFLDAPPIP